MQVSVTRADIAAHARCNGLKCAVALAVSRCVGDAYDVIVCCETVALRQIVNGHAVVRSFQLPAEVWRWVLIADREIEGPRSEPITFEIAI